MSPTSSSESRLQTMLHELAPVTGLVTVLEKRNTGVMMMAEVTQVRLVTRRLIIGVRSPGAAMG